MRAPDGSGDEFLRPKQVQALLGVSRHTLRRLALSDPTFPRWLQLTAGIRVVRRKQVEQWLARKELAARTLHQFARD